MNKCKNSYCDIVALMNICYLKIKEAFININTDRNLYVNMSK